ncbi:OmpA family protein [Sphingosinicella terrae]|jgi:OmpA-OmpF porin, OOP family|uniref:OmpA family protein n=1 Tax=Sphingosinicella terrae TaxID=2172047 RepID=UPI000E0DF85B|nr:OmpA family protein [Sphingosinicella terrae]
MRKLGLSLLVTSMVMVPYAAFSQESAAPSADDYVCALTGDCGEEGQEAAASPATADGEPRISATRGFSLSAPTTTSNRPAPKQTTPTRQTRRQQTSSAQNRRANRPVQVAPGRADLRLAFGNGSAALSAAAEAQVRAFAEALKRPQLANVRVRIEGHTDSSGGRAINESLSQRRAQAVADYLMSQGIEANRLEVRGFGYARPLPGKRASDPDNRRVEAVRVS